jgi:hypothetical protein
LDPKGTFCENTIYSIMERNPIFLKLFDSIRFFEFSVGYMPGVKL